MTRRTPESAAKNREYMRAKRAKAREGVQAQRRGPPPGTGAIPIPPRDDLARMTVRAACAAYGASPATVTTWRRVLGIARPRYPVTAALAGMTLAEVRDRLGCSAPTARLLRRKAGKLASYADNKDR